MIASPISPRTPHSTRPSAFSMLELLVVCVVVAVMAAGAISMLTDANYTRLDAAVRLVRSDLDYARAAALASPTDPIVLRMNADGTGYHLAKLSALNTALQGPNGPLTTTFGVGRASTCVGVSMSAVSGALNVQFGPFGGISDPVPTLRITLLDSDEAVTMLLDPFTGDPTVMYENP